MKSTDVVFVVAVISIFAIGIFGFSKLGNAPENPKSNFEVVDRYDNRCDVVKWSKGNFAEYKFFLDCK